MPNSPTSTEQRAFVSENDKKRDRDGVKGDAKKEEAQAEGTHSPISTSVEPHFASPKDSQNSERAQEPQSPSAQRYEFALHGLLALGSANGGPDAGESDGDFAHMMLPEREHVALEDPTGVTLEPLETLSNVVDIQEIRPTPELQPWPSIGATSEAVMLQMTDERILEYIKHYRYNIAPWMDICDMSQSFGCEVLQLSKVSLPVQYEILALAETSLGTGQHVQNSNLHILAHMQQQKEAQDVESYEALVEVLRTVGAVVTNLSDFWMKEDSAWCGQHVLETLLSEVNRSLKNNGGSLAPAVYWLMARLQLSVALMNPSPVRIPLPTVSITAWEYISATDSERVFRYAHDAVALCIDATVFNQGDEDKWLQQQYGLNRVELWKTLVSGFSRWYKHRPQDFQPVIELYPRDGAISEDGFPTIVFSSGATLMANQLYHTGMLLLLQNKPRFIDRHDSQSPSMSMLWHAHRVCGISLSNDRWDCWDPSLLASLLVAAKTVTHQSQHRAILGTLESVQQLTGWNISHHVEQLALEWQQAEGW
ncbi:hypothetical protein N0V90_005157 [Kalmusia sp. IMI 367209]|nr:hypothetical protein N0V90_005157 [Kalmusia sp. IMI 367209]